MSKPRHQLRGNASRPGEDRVKLKLRLPADGSVDLDKLRAALEAQLHGQTGLIVEEPVVEEPVVVEPEPAEESSEAWPWIKAKVKANPYIIAALSFALLAFVAGIWLLVLDARGQVGISQPLRWILIGSVVGLAVTFAIVVKNQLTAEQKQWIQTSVPTIVSLFSAVLAAVMGIIYLVQESTKGGTGSSLVAGVFIGSVIAFLVSFALVIRRELTIPDSPTSKGWIWIKKNPKWAYIPSLCLAGIVVLVLFVRAIETGGGASPSPADEAKEINQIGTELVGQKEPVETQISFKPGEGYKGRLGMTLGVFGCMGLGLFQLRRIKKARFPDAESLQSGANAAHIDFWPGFRHFVAAQGGYILVAAATGAIVGVIGFGLRNEMNSTALYAFLWTLPGIFLAGMLIFALGFCGINLMPALDLTLKPATGESAILRFMRRKIPHIILMGVVLGVSVSVWRTQLPIGDWISYWIKWTLGIGLAVAAYWKWGKLHQTVKNVQPLPVHTRKKLGHVMIFNLPLVAGLTLPIAFGIPLVSGIHWFHVGWIAPLTGLGIFIGMGMLMNFPRLLRHWLEIIFFPGIVAFICWIPWDNSFWYVFAVLTTLFAFGKVMVQHKDTESGSLLVFPQDPNRGYSPVLNPKANGLEIRWSGMVAVMSFVLITLAAAGTWIWSGEPIEFKGLAKPIALTLTILAPFIVIPTWFNFILGKLEKEKLQSDKT